jgi:hypothetical protein
MFAYILIGLELAILTGVFWYVFIREPKPFRVGNSGLWGSYEGGAMQFQQFSQADLDTLVMEYKQNAHNQVLVDRRVPRFANPHMTPTFASDFRDPSLGSGRQLPLENGWNALYKSNSNSQSNKGAEYGWVAHVDNKPTHAIAEFFTSLLCWFENLSVKLQ